MIFPLVLYRTRRVYNLGAGGLNCAIETASMLTHLWHGVTLAEEYQMARSKLLDRDKKS